MKLITNVLLLTIMLAFSLALATSPLLAQVYKVVDKDGNVTFTDIPPGDGSPPVDLAPISVVETPVQQQTAQEAAAAGADVADTAPMELTLRELRRTYRDFAIVSPQPEESVWSPDGPVSIAWRTSADLRNGMQVLVFIDGKLAATTIQATIPVIGLERGEHSVTAEIRDQRNRQIATAGPVTFFIRQPGLLNRPGGGA